MADKKTDNTLKESSSKKDGSNVASTGPSQATLIKIAVGLLALLILASGAYFFFISSDKPTSTEATANTSKENISLENLTSESIEAEVDATNTLETSSLNRQLTSENKELLEVREEVAALKKENLHVKEQLGKLKKQLSSSVEPTLNTPSPEYDNKRTEAVSQPMPKTNQYSNLYTRNHTRALVSQREPPPEPKWGNFDPLYRGE